MLDDFLTVEPATNEGDRTMALLTMLFKKLNIPLSPKKTMGPLTKLEYLGIILDSVNMQAELPQDKVQRLIKMLHKFSKKTSCTKLAILS